MMGMNELEAKIKVAGIQIRTAICSRRFYTEYVMLDPPAELTEKAKARFREAQRDKRRAHAEGCVEAEREFVEAELRKLCTVEVRGLAEDAILEPEIKKAADTIGRKWNAKAYSKAQRRIRASLCRFIEAELRKLVKKFVMTEDWLPTPENVNALPEPVRRYVHDVVARCDPAGLVQENAVLKDTVAALTKRVEELEGAQGRVPGAAMGALAGTIEKKEATDGDKGQ